jgi:hypothetical protein
MIGEAFGNVFIQTEWSLLPFLNLIPTPSFNVRCWHKADRTRNNNYPVSANVKATADAAQRAIRSRLTYAATIG